MHPDDEAKTEGTPQVDERKTATEAAGGPQTGRAMTFKEQCHFLRDRLKVIEEHLRSLRYDPVYDGDQGYPFQHHEMREHTTLAIRHVEDARMRIGKILQYADDGVSILDKPPIRGLEMTETEAAMEPVPDTARDGGIDKPVDPLLEGQGKQETRRSE